MFKKGKRESEKGEERGDLGEGEQEKKRKRTEGGSGWRGCQVSPGLGGGTSACIITVVSLKVKVLAIHTGHKFYRR